LYLQFLVYPDYQHVRPPEQQHVRDDRTGYPRRVNVAAAAVPLSLPLRPPLVLPRDLVPGELPVRRRAVLAVDREDPELLAVLSLGLVNDVLGI
jgi:hypothetical protein